jgi:hypothetical protein
MNGGGFNFPLFALFVLVAIIVGVSLSLLTELRTWVIFLAAPVISYVGLFVFSQLVDLIETGEVPDITSLREKEEVDIFIPTPPKGLSCPRCGSGDLCAIIYGLLDTTEKLKKAVADRKVTLGGCLVYDEAPQWVCNVCSHKF